MASQLDMDRVESFLLDSNFQLSAAERASNVYEFTGATALTYKDIIALKDALQVVLVIIRAQIHRVSQKQCCLYS